MHDLVEHTGQNLGARPDWMPDPGVYHFVADLLNHRFGEQGFDSTVLPDYWLPLGIVATLDWLCISGWWIWLNTGFYQTDEPYRWVFDYMGYEFDPDQLIILRNEPKKNMFEQRWHTPGITDDERARSLPQVAELFQLYEREPPPQMYLEVIVYGTMMWVMSENGEDWLATLDPMFQCVLKYSVAYYSRWDGKLLDPRKVVCTEREVHTCFCCGKKLWCVDGLFISDTWKYACNHCAVLYFQAGEETMDERDERLAYPHCPHHADEHNIGGKCTYTECPHSPVNAEWIRQKFYDAGEVRMASYRQAAEMAGGTPRSLAGQTVDDMVTHFQRERD